MKTWTRLVITMFCLCAGRTLSAEELRDSTGLVFRLLEAGRYERGEADSAPGFGKDHTDFNTADDERPVHAVVITRPFYLATTEVNVGQFRKFVQATGYKTTAQQAALGAVGWDPTPPAGQPQHIGTFRDGGGFNWQNPGFPQQDDHPVTCVSYADAKAFCRWLGEQERATYRLPTEAEWEYAARAGTTTWFSFGNVYRGQIQKFANIGNVELERAFPDRVRRQWLIDIERDPADQHVFTAPVASYQANPWGLFDLYGNVWEWCEDRYLDTAYTPYQRVGHQELRKRAVDPLNEEAGGSDGDWRVIRGGSWFNAPVQCRSSIRGYFEAVDAACYLGFRVAREAPTEMATAARERFERSETAQATLRRLAGGLKERRDGRLTVGLRHDLLTEELFAALADLDEPVDLILNGEGRLKGADITALAKVKSLTGLTLSGTGAELADDDFAVLAQHPELEELQITGSPQLTNRLLAHLQNLDRLESLQLEGAKIDDAGLMALPRLAKLKTLYLNGTGSTGLVLERFATSPLERVGFSQLSDAGAEYLARFSTLRDVSLSGSPLTGKGLALVAGLPQLNRLDLTGCRELQDADFAVLSRLYDLRSVGLGNTAAGDLAAAGLLELNNLSDLRLGSQQLTDAGIRQLCGIVSLNSLAIQPEATAVTDAAFTDLWRLVNLVNLDIQAPQITGAGLAPLQELPKLETLSLNGPNVADAALRHAARSPFLKQLRVGSPQSTTLSGVTIDGIRALVAARNLRQLELSHRDPQITDAALDEVRAQRRELSIKAL